MFRSLVGPTCKLLRGLGSKDYLSGAVFQQGKNLLAKLHDVARVSISFGMAVSLCGLSSLAKSE